VPILRLIHSTQHPLRLTETRLVRDGGPLGSDDVHLPTIARDVKHHDIAVFGRDGKNGLTRRIKTLEGRTDTLDGDVYRDPKTGRPGVVPRTERLERLLYVAVALLVALLFGVDNLLKGWLGF
jgi:hypothetical protein